VGGRAPERKERNGGICPGEKKTKKEEKVFGGKLDKKVPQKITVGLKVFDRGKSRALGEGNDPEDREEVLCC